MARRPLRLGIAAGLCLALSALPAAPRSLDAIGQRGVLALCAHPNALPFASKHGDPPGFQIELGQALAAQLGVRLAQHWVINSFQYRRADCDIVLDAIADKSALAEVGLRLSRPYYRSGVALAVPGNSSVTSLDGLGAGRRVGVPVGSLVAMRLAQKGIETSPFAFEDEIMEALARHAIDAAAVTPAAIGWFNATHPDAPVRRIAAFADDPDLNWNVAVGMLRPDDRLKDGIDAALGHLIADGTIGRIYARYGVELQPPL
jgi:polar amino acid transport system substrate-binding protein